MLQVPRHLLARAAEQLPGGEHPSAPGGRVGVQQLGGQPRPRVLHHQPLPGGRGHGVRAGVARRTSLGLPHGPRLPGAAWRSY